MLSAADEDRLRRALERRKELDLVHLNRVRGPWQTGAGLVFRLRHLRTIAHRLFTPPHRRSPTPVPRPPIDSVAVTFVGHGSVMLSTATTRAIVDPFFAGFLAGVRRAEHAALDAADAAEIDLIVISHAHRDHLHPPSLRRLPRAATIVVPPGCAPQVASVGFGRVVTLAPGESLAHRDLRVTAVAARHDGSSAFLWRGSNGYVVESSSAAIYLAGDTGYFSGFADIGRRFAPDVALLPIGGYQPLALRAAHMSPVDALAAFDELHARLLVPISHGSFSLGYEPIDEPARWLRELCVARGLGDRVRILANGETVVVRRGGHTGADAPIS